MNKTDIEYLDVTWNPIAMRCTPVSPGCAHCWHLGMADRLAGNSAFPDDMRAAYAGSGPPVLVEKRLNEPLKRKKPAMIGVQFMGDFFHSAVTLAQKAQILKVIGQCPQHTFLILTKRPEPMSLFQHVCGGLDDPNIILGVSIENQATADARIPLLLDTPAAKRIVSYEPALEPLDLWSAFSVIDGHGEPSGPRCNKDGSLMIDWVICGGESGPGARSMHPQWARDVRDACQEAGVPFFFKQWGEYLHESQFLLPYERWLYEKAPLYEFPGHEGAYVRVGKKQAGRLLDGWLWDRMPERICNQMQSCRNTEA